MPELPDLTVYIEHLGRRVLRQTIERVRLASPFVLRSVDAPLREVERRRVDGLRLLGKRIVLELEGDLFLVLHLMIAGRLHWRPPRAAIPRKLGLAAFDFARGTLLLTEASTKKRAAMHVVRGEAALAEHDRGGIEPLAADAESFRAALLRERHTIKRALTDPRLFAGVGNAYSDEILHAARLSPLRLTSQLDDEQIYRLREATRKTLREWIDRLLAEAGTEFPENVTAFRPEMAVHGRYRKPCPVCGTAVQRVRYAENECNYCPRCQTGGKLLADRSLSRLLRDDWPRTIEDLEKRRSRPPP